MMTDRYFDKVDTKLISNFIDVRLEEKKHHERKYIEYRRLEKLRGGG